MPNGTYGGVRGKETKVGQKTFVSRPTRFPRNPQTPVRLDRELVALFAPIFLSLLWHSSL
jgi:hypothetical protein